jgi:HlyD family secretion protein
MRKLIVLVVVVALLGAAGFGVWHLRAAAHGDSPYRTEEATRGDLLASFSATGTLEPEDIIDVGAQVAGQIKEFGVDAKGAHFQLTDASLAYLRDWGVSEGVLSKLGALKDKRFDTQDAFVAELAKVLSSDELAGARELVVPAAKVGKPIDYGSEVEAGDLLARIDYSLYLAKVNQSQAYVNQQEAAYKQSIAKVDEAKAAVKVADATLQVDKANYDVASRNWDRAQRIGLQAQAQQDYDTYYAAFQTSRAMVTKDEAALAQAKVMVTDAQSAVETAKAAWDSAKAQLAQDRINLGYTQIKAPVKGVIIDRRVTLGQTVQSSFNTPSLFLLARDLKKMKVWASVNEADIGQVHVGQAVKFTVDAFPGEVFTGTVGLIRLNATMTNNVVTYTVEVQTENSSLKLKPYLTANLTFLVSQRKDVLTVSNEALRWKPDPKQVAPADRGAYQKSMQRRAAADAAKEEGGAARPGKEGGKGGAQHHGTVWVADGEFVKPVKVQVGLTDSTRTEITGGELKEGQAVVTGEALMQAGNDGGSNPFTPQVFGNKKQ